MSLPMPWVDKIFTKLTVVYGRDFLSRWEGINIEEVKADWAKELAGFINHPDSISYALKNMPDSGKPPTVLEFRAICRKAPSVEPLRIEHEPAQPSKVALELERLKMSINSGKSDPKDWARRHIARHQAGEPVKPLTLRFAREALGIKT